MEVHGMQRRLSAIMSADVVGYSALMAADEEGTLARLKAQRGELIEPTIAEHGGRVFKLMGDGLLAEFPSVVEAVRAGIQIQQDLAARNEELPSNRQMVFRIGINHGDVIVDGDDLYGDDVNIAARIEALAEPGGICISDRVYGDIRGKIDLDFADLGDQELKNIPELVQVYRILIDADDIATAKRNLKEKAHLRYAILAVAVMLFVALAGSAAWQLSRQPEPDVLSSPLSAHSSIAVLPFTNLSSDPDQEYLSDGITTDIITDLSRFHDIFVIAANSVFTYKGKAVKVRQVAQELAVRYVLQGSIQRRDEKIRINAQLIDGTTGQLLWAERFDESAVDIFDLQNEITRRIVRTLAIRLTDIELKQAFVKPTRDLKAYDYVLRARALAEQSSPDENFQARELFRQAIEIDPAYASAYAGLGRTWFEPMLWGWTGSPQKALTQAHELAKKAISLDAFNFEGHRLLAGVYAIRRQHDLALVETERMIAINPNDSRGYTEQGRVMVWAGHIDGAILSLETALRFDPYVNLRSLWHLSLAYYLNGRYKEARAVLEKIIESRRDNAFDYVLLAASYAQMDLPDKAAAAATAVLRLNPYFLVKEFGPQFRDPADAARVAEGLRKAGLK